MVQPTDYELARAQRMAENRRKMEEMGLVEASRGLTAATAAPQLQAGSERAPRLKKRRAPEPEPASLEPTRLSRRLRGETALSAEAAAAAGRAEAEAEGRARRATVRKQLTLVEGQQLAAPFTLWSIGVTVWELGQLQRGAWAHRYWSSSGCLFHHAYPVGYRATKVVFGRTYEMRIEEGPAGPLFKVIDQQTGAMFSGESPTKPWTDVCIAQRTGQRISGPLFFGFSDALTQRAIAVNLYTPAELAAALRGERVLAADVAPDEQAARELCSVEGIGEATAIVLARTTALGGSRHTGLDSLRSWASASDANAQALFNFLTTSSELPESTRRWPAWRQHLVPRIVAALSGRQIGSGSGLEAEHAAEGAAEEGCDAAGASSSSAADGAHAQQLGAAVHEAGGGDATATAVSHDEREAGPPAQQTQTGTLVQQQQQEQEGRGQQRPGTDSAAPEPYSTAGPSRDSGAKENRQPVAKQPGAGSIAAAAAMAATQRGSSARQRRANSQLAGYLLEYD